MARQNPTVADWLAWGEATIEVHCDGPRCGRFAVLRLDGLDPRLTHSEIGRRARCAVCGHRGGRVMMDMAAHYERLRATGWDCRPATAGQGARGPDDTEPL